MMEEWKDPVVQRSAIQMLSWLRRVFLLAAVPASFLMFVFSCYHRSYAGIGGVTVLANSVQVKMNDCFAVVLNPDQFCNLVSCIVLQTDTAEKADGEKGNACLCWHRAAIAPRVDRVLKPY